jgi:putative tryptophan/tyrosine transport system substrate-binding protein
MSGRDSGPPPTSPDPPPPGEGRKSIYRRELFALLGGGAAWPLAARAQQTEQTRLIGVLMGASESDPVSRMHLAAFRSAIQDLGWTEGRNVRFEIRWAGGDIEQVRAFAAELVKLAPNVILAHSTLSVAALKQATQSIPIVFVIVNEPIAQGVVPNVAHPGGNITGFSYVDYSMIGKALGLLKEIAPAVTRVGFIFNPDDYPYYEVYLRTFQEQRQALSLDVTAMRFHSDAEIEAAIKTFAAAPGGSVFASPSNFVLVHRRAIIQQALQSRLPAVMLNRDSVAEGGLMAYAPDQTDIFRRSAAYVDRILKGANPGDLPVQAPTKFEFVVNLKTAKALGLSVSSNLLAIADEVIE